MSQIGGDIDDRTRGGALVEIEDADLARDAAHRDARDAGTRGEDETGVGGGMVGLWIFESALHGRQVSIRQRTGQRRVADQDFAVRVPRGDPADAQ